MNPQFAVPPFGPPAVHTPLPAFVLSLLSVAWKPFLGGGGREGKASRGRDTRTDAAICRAQFLFVSAFEAGLAFNGASP